MELVARTDQTLLGDRGELSHAPSVASAHACVTRRLAAMALSAMTLSAMTLSAMALSARGSVAWSSETWGASCAVRGRSAVRGQHVHWDSGAGRRYGRPWSLARRFQAAHPRIRPPRSLGPARTTAPGSGVYRSRETVVPTRAARALAAHRVRLPKRLRSLC